MLRRTEQSGVDPTTFPRRPDRERVEKVHPATHYFGRRVHCPGQSQSSFAGTPDTPCTVALALTGVGQMPADAAGEVRAVVAAVQHLTAAATGFAIGSGLRTEKPGTGATAIGRERKNGPSNQDALAGALPFQQEFFAADGDVDARERLAVRRSPGANEGATGIQQPFAVQVADIERWGSFAGGPLQVGFDAWHRGSVAENEKLEENLAEASGAVRCLLPD